METTPSLYSSSQSRNMVLGFILLLTAFLLFISLHIINALLGAVIFYILFRPLYLYLHKKKQIRSSFSAALVLVASFLAVVVPVSGLCWLIVSKLMDFQKHPEALTAIVDKVTGLLGTSFDKKELLHSGLSGASKWALGMLSLFVSGAARLFISLLILYFTLYFMLSSSAEFEKTLLKYLPFKKEQSSRFGEELKKSTYSNIFGQGIIAMSQGIIVATGFLIFGIPDALFWGTVSLFVCFLPVVGAPLIIIPASIIEISAGHTTAGVGILIYGLVLVTVVDNVLRQFIARKIADTHPLITIIGVIIGVPVFGLVGIVVGPLLLSFFLLLIKTYEENYAVSKPASEVNGHVQKP